MPDLKGATYFGVLPAFTRKCLLSAKSGTVGGRESRISEAYREIKDETDENAASDGGTQEPEAPIE